MITRKYYIPLKLTILYVAITFLLSVIGPVTYLKYDYKYWLVFMYLFAVFAFMALGYNVGLRSNRVTRFIIVKKTKKEKGWKSAYKLIKISIIVALLSLILEVLYLYASGSFHISLSSLGDNYFQDIDGSSGIMVFRFATDFFRVSCCTMGFFYFKRLKKKYRLGVILVALLILSVALFGYGQQKSIGDLFIYLAVALFTNSIKSVAKLSSRTKKIIIIGGITVLFALAFIQSQRYKMIGVTASNYASRSTGEIGYNTDSIIFKIFGDDIGFGLSVILTSYLSMGYYGLSLCMQMPFKWTYGVGSSRALTKLLEKIGILGIDSRTYLGRLGSTYGRDGLASWNTIFPWLASDMTYLGVIFYFFFVGYVMGKSWKEVLERDNPISYMMFAILMLMVCFVPANNQLFHSYGSFVSTICILFLWFFSRGNYNVSESEN